MGLTQLDIIRKQIESTVKNRAAGEAAKLRRKTSLIGEISRLAGRANSTIDGAGRDAARRTPARTATSAARRSRRFTPRRITGAGCSGGRQGLRRRWCWRWPRCGCWSIIRF